jgi:hypothetical protein
MGGQSEPLLPLCHGSLCFGFDSYFTVGYPYSQWIVSIFAPLGKAYLMSYAVGVCCTHTDG